MQDKIFQNKVCLITGGTRGIGKAIVQMFAAQAATLVITYRGDESAAAAARQMLNEAGVVFELVKCDSTNPAEIDSLIAFIKQRFGRLDVLVNNAGRTFDGAFAALDPDEFLFVVDTNLLGTLRLSLAAIPLLTASKGTIVNMSSLAGVAGKEGQVVYATTKGGINGLTRMLARNLGGKGIRVNAIAPGFIRTEMVADLPESTYAHVLAGTACGTMGEPEDVANTAAFLAGAQSAYINGAVIRIDGGFHK